MNSRSAELKARLAVRHAGLFNARHRIGARVLYIATPGADPVPTRTSSEAFELAGRSLVYVRHTLDPVETDSLYAIPLALTPPAQGYAAARGRLLRAVLVFAGGFATAVAVALLMPPAKATAPEHIVIDCFEPGDAPAEVEGESGRAQA
ncbi:MAG: hypothetical protein PHW25_17550 [Zoogloea sp.]|jgi:hypothetical protein|uniref:hypothetical protein n=1 Tax=Zoogloea sp. TaxID=49181 RepID=UPI002606FA13|nr:hypothetical protein [Zoogloea sp.]MDD3328890.1 hypothetical protein [Zoogloea sp.]